MLSWRLLYFLLDVDECQNNSLHNCHVNATCIDSVGSFDCECVEGFFGNGVECQSETAHSLQHEQLVTYVVVLL